MINGKKGKEKDEFGVVRAWFAAGNAVNLLTDTSDKAFAKELDRVAGLRTLAETYAPDLKEVNLMQEWILFAMAEMDLIQRQIVQTKVVFKDFLAGDIKDDEAEGDIDLRGYFN